MKQLILRRDPFVGPLHELIVVVTAGALVTNERVALALPLEVDAVLPLASFREARPFPVDEREALEVLEQVHEDPATDLPVLGLANVDHAHVPHGQGGKELIKPRIPVRSR